MNEASLAVVVNMRDNASTGMQNFGKTMKTASAETMNFRLAIIAVGGVMSHMSSLLNQLDDPTAKTASNFLRMASYVTMTAGSIMYMIPQITALIKWIRQLSVAQAVLNALSGPKGWVSLGAAAVVGTGAGFAIGSMTSGHRESTVSRTTIVNNNIQGSVITERELGDISRREIIKNQERNSSSGIK
jgi:hypothetical protein